MTQPMPRDHRVAGALIGSAVGDALGAPFEFGPAGQFSARFLTDARGVATEMCGGGSLDREPGEFTDDTQMALLVAASLVERGGLDEADLFDRFRTWLRADPPDAGKQTRAVLGSGRQWDVAAAEHFARSGHAAGNGSLMRTTPAAIWFARSGTEATMDAARRISALTHGDPSAGEGCAVFHELVRVALDGGDPLAAIPATLELVTPEHGGRWATVLAPDWTPDQATESNGAVWPTLGSAVWALRHADDFARVMRLVIDLGGDTDTVAAVAGGLAGAVLGIAGIPMRWTSVVHGRVPGYADKRWDLADLHALAMTLDGSPTNRHVAARSARIEPREVLPGVWAADLDGARNSSPDFAVVSLCRTGEPFGHEVQRFAYLTDDDANSEVDAVLADVLDDIAALRAEGRPVLVHCHGGASRTGLVLRAWLRRTEGLSAAEATARVQDAWPHLGLWNDSFTAALDRLPRSTGAASG
ncbi:MULTISPECIES: ADP-ribosylglycohydrolase family protein [unclassified Modestobacter]|uniref:ADP-ribosylglycohydrolase family protein n=1 Tax=unclassified Modestobacter TaxID=2643866 RepID=UPI0022AA29E3|nr:MULTISPECIES: ADP-ribosylglycohydrolase family protein [unclassified Modestobacter]MCZ2826669.1 ADP-ribosylglycohydrolase family protein [Modestobacter sp. VKM Ac-2981]MCZ2855049.1 ADP-ribosylglycohydrolase family protein [Modestobacter sp. VKM Ac-2982]